MTQLFLRLLMAHMIGDFLLQTNAVYKLKIKTIQGQILHGIIIFTTSLLLTVDYLQAPLFLAYLVFIAIIHIIQDLIKTRYFNNTPFPFWPFIADQIMHTLTIATIFLLPLPVEGKYFLKPSCPIFNLCHDTRLTCLIIGYIFVSWQGVYFIETFKKTFLKTNTAKHPLSTKEKYYGIAERIILTTLAFLGWPFYLLIPTFALVRFSFKNLKSVPSSILGLILSITTSTLLKWILK